MPGGTEIGPGTSKGEVFPRHTRNNEYNEDEEEEEEAGSIIPDRAGKHSFCRLCLTHSDVLSPLFPQNAAPDQTLLAQIYDCVEVQIMLPDDIKSFICTECVQQINSFACFKELCKSNDQLLKSQSFGQESDNDEAGCSPISLTPEVTIVSEENPSTPDTSLLNKLFQQGVEVEPIGGAHSNAIVFGTSQQLGGNLDDKEAERKAKNAARMRRWRMRQRIKQEQQIVVTQERKPATEPTTQEVVEQEEALRIQQAREMFAFLAQQQLRQVEAEIRRLKEGVQQQDEQEQIKESAEEQVKMEPVLQQKGESSRRTSPTSESQLASLRRSRAEYMRKWRARRQSQQQQMFGVVGRPPTISPAPGEVEKLILQRHNRAEYMRRWRRERLKQELTPEEFDLWCAKSEQRRRFQQALRESASSAGDETMDCGGESDADKSCYSFDGLPQQS